jgi:hypothetical protein
LGQLKYWVGGWDLFCLLYSTGPAAELEWLCARVLWVVYIYKQSPLLIWGAWALAAFNCLVEFPSLSASFASRGA